VAQRSPCQRTCAAHKSRDRLPPKKKAGGLVLLDFWPAYRKEGATLVDLRMFDPDDRSANPRLVFRPEKLRELGIPDALIEAAAKSDPQGFLLFDDLPNQTELATGHGN
jgi:hypothetical protein